MVEDAMVLVDREGVMGAVKVRKGSTWYWVLKPDLKPGEYSRYSSAILAHFCGKTYGFYHAFGIC